MSLQSFRTSRSRTCTASHRHERGSPRHSPPGGRRDQTSDNMWLTRDAVTEVETVGGQADHLQPTKTRTDAVWAGDMMHHGAIRSIHLCAAGLKRDPVNEVFRLEEHRQKTCPRWPPRRVAMPQRPALPPSRVLTSDKVHFSSVRGFSSDLR